MTSGISPRITRLLRAPGLRAVQGALASLVLQQRSEPERLREMAVLVPTRGAAEELRRTLENRMLERDFGAMILPDLLTRAEFYARLHEKTPGCPPLLTEFEREVLFRRGAMEAAAAGFEAPFALRPGLIGELLGFYDELRRRDRTLDAFERLMAGALEPSADSDRGAARLLDLTRFLVAAFRAFDRLTADSGGIDEHALRGRLLAHEDNSEEGSGPAYRHVVVTVADQAADPRGLWTADFDLLARLHGLERLDVLVTDTVLAAGFHQRILDVLPGIEEMPAGAAGPLPVLAAPAHPPDANPVNWFVSRDREEELADVARAVKRGTMPPGRAALVFQRPLPYLYLARRVFPDARVPYQALDALPLAAEPLAAALDLVFTFLLSQGTRASLVEMLRSPHWTFATPRGAVTASHAAAVDALLKERRYLGGWERLSSVVSSVAAGAEDGRPTRQGGTDLALPALEAAHACYEELRPVLEGETASAQVSGLLAFVRAHERLPAFDAPWRARHLRARAAVLAAFEALRDAHRRHDDRPLPLRDLVGAVRRWVEGQTFAPRTGDSGIRLLDAASAAFADLDELRLIGMAEGDWPERSRRSIFFPLSLLMPLGWPSEGERLAGARARFHDLVLLPARRVSASTFLLEDDAIVTPSTLLEDFDVLGLPVERVPRPSAQRMFVHEALSMEPAAPDLLEASARGWAALRAGRSSGETAAYHGSAGARQPGVYAVSHIERYLDCPFKYFAAHVLRLKEERDEESVLTPQERGQILHDVFEAFFASWQAEGHGAITAANLAEASARFTAVAEARLAMLPESERALERTHLLGSAAAPGLAERAFAFEIEQGGEVIERLLEHALEGEFDFRAGDRTRRVSLRAKADRIDLMADGTLRVVDYKLSKAPKAARALQLPVYGVCAEQRLAGRHGRQWTLGRAGYVAFKEKQPFTSLGGGSSLADAVADGQARLLETLDAIEAGEFPPRPDEPFLCTRCGFATVCRKDYIGDE